MSSAATITAGGGHKGGWILPGNFPEPSRFPTYFRNYNKVLLDANICKGLYRLMDGAGELDDIADFLIVSGDAAGSTQIYHPTPTLRSILDGNSLVEFTVFVYIFKNVTAIYKLKIILEIAGVFLETLSPDCALFHVILRVFL